MEIQDGGGWLKADWFSDDQNSFEAYLSQAVDN